MEKIGVRSLFVFVFLSLLFLFLDFRGNLMFIRNASGFLNSPMYNISYIVRNSFNDTFSFLTFWRSGEQRIRNLEQVNVELIVKAGRAEGLERENKLLRQQLGVTVLVDRKMMPAKVLGIGRYLIVDAGENEAVKKGQIVVYKGILVGQVANVGGRVSYVRLPTDPGSKIPAVVLDHPEIKGIAIGQFNSSITLDQIVQTDKLSVGQVVETSGEDGKFENGLVIGKIGKILSKPSDLFKKAEIKPSIRYDKLEMVFILE